MLDSFFIIWVSQVSVQAFSDEDPQGRRTLGMILKYLCQTKLYLQRNASSSAVLSDLLCLPGLFLHRRKAENSDPLRKVLKIMFYVMHFGQQTQP